MTRLSLRQRCNFGLQDCFVLLGLFSLLAIQMHEFAVDPGVGWHLRSGEYVLHNEAVPRFDPFLASASPRRWISDQWLADAALFGAYAVGSWPLVYGVLTAVYLAAYFLVAYPLSARATTAPILGALLTFLAFKLGQIHFILRPVIFGFLGFAIVVTAVWRSRFRDPAPSPSTSALIGALPLVFLVWANLHPSFVLGLLFLALHPLGLALDRICGIDPGVKLEVRRSLGLLAACLLATCVNPNGIELHRSIISLGTDQFFMNFHQEWLPPNPLAGVGLTLTLVCVLGGVSLISERRPRSWRSFEILVVVVFGALAFQAVRMIPFFALAVIVPFSRSIANHTYIAPAPRGIGAHLRQSWRSLSNEALNSSRGVIVTAVVIVLLAVDPLVRGRLLFFGGPFGPSHSKYPYTAAHKLKDRATPTTPVIVAAPPDWGGFLVFEGGPFVRPLIDDRNTLLGADFYREFYAAFSPSGNLEGYLRAHNATHILLPREAALTTTFETEGRFPIILQDEVSTLFGAQRAP